MQNSPVLSSFQALACTLVLAAIPAAPVAAVEFPERLATLWTPVQEWTIEAERFDGNPFDTEGTAVFAHQAEGTVHSTGIYHAGGNLWRFRFSPTRTGIWTFRTESTHDALAGHSGTVTVTPNRDPGARGFLTATEGSKWAWQIGEDGETFAFTPQLVMYKSLDAIAAMSDEQIEADLELWFEDHGFNGVHVMVFCRWFDFDKERHSEFGTDDPTPDPRTFAVLERLITMTHRAGGFVHIWKWGDEQRKMTPARWGINGAVDQRLQRYIAARLGPVPGWTLGYGFDLWEWVDAPQIHAWHDYMHQHLGWPHFVGGRTHAHHTPITEAMTYGLDYVGYETHRPDYDTYVAALAQRPDRPAFMEDRFRIRYSPYRDKDYSPDDTRRGLWRSAMAGGVANIWGYMLPSDDQGGARPYPNRLQIRTYADFFAQRSLNGLERDNERTDGVCLRRGQAHFLFYREDAHSVRLDLTGMDGARPAVAVDTKVPYVEFDLGELTPGVHEWSAPYASDWAVAVGRFQESP